MGDAIKLISWTEEQCKHWDKTVIRLDHPAAEVTPDLMIELIRTMQQGHRLAAGHALLTAQVLVGAAEKAEAAAKKG